MYAGVSPTLLASLSQVLSMPQTQPSPWFEPQNKASSSKPKLWQGMPASVFPIYLLFELFAHWLPPVHRLHCFYTDRVIDRIDLELLTISSRRKRATFKELFLNRIRLSGYSKVLINGAIAPGQSSTWERFRDVIKRVNDEMKWVEEVEVQYNKSKNGPLPAPLVVAAPGEVFEGAAIPHFGTILDL